MRYRVKQFIWAITARMNEEDVLFMKHYLSKKEQELFLKLRVYEQKHSIRVAYELQKCAKENQVEEYIRLGLLHDVGKSKYPLNPVEKSVIVLLNRLSKEKIQRWNGLKMVKCYYQHGEIGYQLLKELGNYSDRKSVV